jgi:N-methylhydantoinase A/oxoprolinase/acetone carboxylase beta subunit
VPKGLQNIEQPHVKNQKTYLIGIDTGGTYTDAVLIDETEKRIICAEKSITTKGNLAIGIGDALSRVLAAAPQPLDPGQIQSLSVSTTLATNAVVEGHGSPCGVVLIGFDQKMIERTGIPAAFPDMPILSITGGHNHNGEEQAKLDEAALRQLVTQATEKVSAFAISSAFAVRNAAHELRAQAIITELTGKPATLSTEISSALDAPRRALTATLNARLIAHITRLVASVREAAASHGIACPIMVVRGDGSLASAEQVRMRPIETVLSGPAASLIGAKWLSGLSDFILSDIGGTTTDVGVLTNGRPQIAEDGARVGGWRTMVRAIDINTIGLGGDSEVSIGLNGVLSIGPQRALPVSLLAHRRPETIAMLEADLAETEGGSMLGKFVVRPFGGEQGMPTHGLSKTEQEVLAMVTDMPMALRRVAPSPQNQRAVQSLRRKGLLQFATFTPSDAAHILNLQSNWSRQAAEIAAKLNARFRTMKMPDDASAKAFCEEVWSKTAELSARAILLSALGDKFEETSLLAKVCEGVSAVNLTTIRISPTVPIVAVGGPAEVFYPEVARRLNCEVHFAEHHSVANAVGAAVGNVMNVVEATVDGDGQGLFRVYCEGATAVHGTASAALADAEQRATTAARNRALAFGARDPHVTCKARKHLLPGAVDDDGLLSAVLIAEATGHAGS